MEVSAWLRDLGLQQYEQMFREHAIDADVLLELTDEHLKELGVPLGHRVKMLKAIGKLRAAGEPGESTGTAARAAGLPEGERRQVTVLYADLVGYTALSRELDAEEVHAVLERFFELVDGIVQDHGGTVDKHIGDCVMAVFGAPVAHGNDAERGARAALDIRGRVPALGHRLSRAIDVHVGVASGQVVASGTGSARHRQYTVTGESVNLAARLTEHAAAGEVLISDGVHRELPERLVCEAAGQLEVKGLSEPVRAWRLVDVTATPSSSSRPFIGRRAELRQFEGLLRACRETGCGQAVHVRGEAGVGKTRLVEEFGRIAGAEGFAVHVGLVLDFGTGTGRDAIRALLRSLLGLQFDAKESADQAAAERAISEGIVAEDDRVYLNDLLDLPQPEPLRVLYQAMDNERRNAGKRETVATAVRQVSLCNPLLLVVEDVHWADRLTLAHLASLTGATTTCPGLLVMTSRPEGDPLDVAWCAGTEGSSLMTVDLGPLRPQEAEALAGTYVRAGGEFARRCVARSGGNPLFLEHLVRNAEASTDPEGVPGSIQSLVQARLDRLDPLDKRAVQAASVFGQRFGLGALRHLIDHADYDGTRLVDHFLVRPAPEGFLFAHALIRDVAYDSLLKARRCELHRRAAEWFAERDAVLHAEHLERAANPAEAARAYLEAARAEAGHYHHERAAKLAAHGLELAEDPALRHELACLRGDLLRDLGESTESIAVFERALAAAQNDAERCRALIGLAAGLRIVDRYDDALTALDQAQVAAEAADMICELADIRSLRGNLCFPLGRLEQCRGEHQRALDLARDAGAPEAEVRALGGLGDAAYASGRMITAFNHFDRCIRLCREHGFAGVEVANLFMRGCTHLYRHEPEPALRDARTNLEGARRVGNLRAEINCFDLIGYASLAFGAADGAATSDDIEDYCSRGLALTARIGARRFEPVILCNLAWLTLRRGERTEAERLARDAVAISRETGLSFTGPWALGMLVRTTEDASTRQEALAEAESILERGAVAHCHLWFRRLATEALVEAADWQAVEDHAAALETYARNEPLPWTEFWVRCGRAFAAYGRSDHDAQVEADLVWLRAEAERTGMSSVFTLLDRTLGGNCSRPPDPTDFK